MEGRPIAAEGAAWGAVVFVHIGGAAVWFTDPEYAVTILPFSCPLLALAGGLMGLFRPLRPALFVAAMIIGGAYFALLPALLVGYAGASSYAAFAVLALGCLLGTRQGWTMRQRRNTSPRGCS
jgi:hypothetical protein